MGAIYNRLWNEIVQLRWEWKQYRSLFFESEPVAALNEAAPSFFGLVQHALEQHVISGIANLTDKAENAKQSNLTVRRLPALARVAAHRQAGRGRAEAALADVTRNGRPVARAAWVYCQSWVEQTPRREVENGEPLGRACVHVGDVSTARA